MRKHTPKNHEEEILLFARTLSEPNIWREYESISLGSHKNPNPEVISVKFVPKSAILKFPFS